MNAISTFLWFDGDAEAAAHHYVSIFPNSSIYADVGISGLMPISWLCRCGVTRWG